MSEQPERAAEPTPSDDWRAVESSATGSHPPLPPTVKWGGLGLLGLLIVGAILAGIGLGGGFGGGNPSGTSSPTPELVMEPPIQVGEYVRGRLSTTDPSASQASTRQVGADYSDGTVGVFFLMVWPQNDLATFMTDAGIELTTASTGPSASSSPEPSVKVEPSGIVCGVSQDTDRVACGKLVRGTGVMVAALSGQAEEEIRTLLDEFEHAVTP